MDDLSLYDILEVSPRASKEVIEKAYKTLVKKYHPDLNPLEKRKEMEERLKLLNKAYEILMDDEKRRLYDEGLLGMYYNYNPFYSSYSDDNYSNEKTYDEADETEDIDETNKSDYIDNDLKKNYKVSEEIINSSLTPHPWVRYFARVLDLYLWNIVFYNIIEPKSVISIFYNLGIYTEDAATIQLLLQITSYIIWIFIEALFISLYGATPGKWILNTKVVNINGEFLEYNQALKRSFLVFVKGFGLSIPLINLITMGYWYYKIKNVEKTFGLTSWDKECGSRVITGKIEWWRYILYISSVFIAFIAIYILNILILVKTYIIIQIMIITVLFVILYIFSLFRKI